VNDATWLADLLAHGLIRASFVPPPTIQELRDLTRTRKQVTREIVQRVQRIQAVLEEANIKLCSVITNIMGASGRRILPAVCVSIIGSCSHSICERSSIWRTALRLSTPALCPRCRPFTTSPNG
jgi:hypothetical protein